jgi:hypothetical protein
VISRMKIKCEVCGNLGFLQHLSQNYYRVKHYLGTIDGKLKFEYHKQSLAYVKSNLDVPAIVREIDPIDPKAIDPKLNASDSFNQNGLRASSSVRIEPCLQHQPPKLGVVGSNPTSPAIN